MAGNGTAVIVKSQCKRSAYLCVCMRGKERRRENERVGRCSEKQGGGMYEGG